MSPRAKVIIREVIAPTLIVLAFVLVLGLTAGCLGPS